MLAIPAWRTEIVWELITGVRVCLRTVSHLRYSSESNRYPTAWIWLYHLLFICVLQYFALNAAGLIFSWYVKNLIYIEVWLSLVERCVRDAEVACSNPVTSTINLVLRNEMFLSIAKAMAYHHALARIPSTTALPLLYLISR